MQAHGTTQGTLGAGTDITPVLVLAPVAGSDQCQAESSLEQYARRAGDAHRRVHDELAGLGQVFSQQRALHVTAQGVLDGNGEESGL